MSLTLPSKGPRRLGDCVNTLESSSFFWFLQFSVARQKNGWDPIVLVLSRCTGARGAPSIPLTQNWLHRGAGKWGGGEGEGSLGFPCTLHSVTQGVAEWGSASVPKLLGTSGLQGRNAKRWECLGREEAGSAYPRGAPWELPLRPSACFQA